MPIARKNLQIKNREAEIEKQLNDLDSAINQFSKKKVFIKAD